MKMKKLTFEIFIDAPIEKVWNTMFEKETYEKWTTEFSEGSSYEGSSYEGSWEQGSEIRFVDPSGAGMIAEIAENRLHEFVSIKHLGMIKKGESALEATKDWAEAYENYTFESKDGGTLITVHQDILPEYEEMFKEMWPLALVK